MRVEAKICGLCRPEDARAAAEAGADYLGVVFAAGPRRCDRDRARGIWAGLSRPRAGVFVDAAWEDVVGLAADLELAVVQLHGSEAPGFCRRVREAGDWAVWKAVRVADGSGLEAALERYADHVDGILLEGLSARGRGGVGARFDWSCVERLGRDWPQGVKRVLAGGLDARNVSEAIEAVRPDVVDVSSGVEVSVGRKDAAAVRAFVAAVRRSAG